jgi:Zn-dependent protease with chaperone function
MSWLLLQTVAQVSSERILNSLPEGFLIVFCAWVLLRVLRKQNSGTRFAIWFLVLLTVAALPVLNGFGHGLALPAWQSMRPAVTIPANWGFYVFLFWAFGASVAMARLTAGFWRLLQLRRSCTPIVAQDLDPAVRRMVEAIVAPRPQPAADGRGRPRPGGSTSVTVAISEHLQVPAAIGFWKRTIVLPQWALRELPPDDLNAILLHEFAHLRRGDDWTNLVQKTVRALFFFHPAVWWIENRLSVEREMACDDAVLAETANPQGYAACLVSLLEKSVAHRHSSERPAHKRWSMAQAAVNRAREAALRLAQILDSSRPEATRVWRPALGLVAAFSLVCLLALPHTPEFVAFDRGADRASTVQGVTESDNDHLYSAAVGQRSLQTAALIPATLHIDEPPALGAAPKVVHAHAHGRANDVARSLPAPTPESSAPMNSESPDQLVAINAITDQEIVPEFRTLVFFETTQYRTAGGTVWNVQIWQVTLVGAARERMMRVPVANKI